MAEGKMPSEGRLSTLAGAMALGLSFFFALPASAKDGPVAVDAEIVLAVDVSFSMDQEEQVLQRRGYADALTSEAFIMALKSGVHGKIAIAYLQWASYRDTDVLLPWTVIDGPEAAVDFADKLMSAPYRRAQRTSISGAIDASARLFANNGFNGLRQVIDVSGDGANNDGRPVQMARDDAVKKGITINGLPLVGIRPSWNYADIPNLDLYYQDCVIGGEGAFMVAIRDRKGFTDATRTKLIQEIAAPSIPPIDFSVVPAQEREPRVNCMIGEAMWNRRWGN
jgi:hypothetical protein